jgi:hypothetical protein
VVGCHETMKRRNFLAGLIGIASITKAETSKPLVVAGFDPAFNEEDLTVIAVYDETKYRGDFSWHFAPRQCGKTAASSAPI